MTKLQSEIIGRIAMLVIGVALCYGAYKCFAVAAELEANPAHPDSRGKRFSGSYLPFLIGCGLAAIGGTLAMAGVLKVATLAKVMRINPPRTGDNDLPDNMRGPWRF